MTKTKQCRTCKQVKNRTEFHKSSYHKTKAGSVTMSVKPDCKVCANRIQTEKFNEMLNSLVPVWECSKCGYDKCRAALDFHHTESDKKDFMISGRRSVNPEKLKKEIEKCILLCCRCHRELHATESTLL